MRLETADLWSFAGKADALCVTTNGSFRRNGEAVMGVGVAFQAAARFPGIADRVGDAVRTLGNVPAIVWNDPVVVTFPTKPGSRAVATREDVEALLPSKRAVFRLGCPAPGWAFRSDLGLIAESARRLRALADERRWSLVVLPCPGCENGGLAWADVEPVLDVHLDARFLCVARPPRGR